jgi:hypothetical protein
VSAGEAEALVCGFADPGGAVAGACWRLGGKEGGALLAGDAVSGAEVEISDADGGGLRLLLSAGGASCEVSLTPRSDQVALRSADGEPAGLSAAICAAEVEFALDRRGRSVGCPGHLTRWAGEALGDDEALRHLAVPFGEDGLLTLVATRPAGAEGHGDEQVAAWRLEPEGASTAFAESLLSTQFDGEGRPTRVGVELWPVSQGDAPEHLMRAAGTAIGVAGAGGVTATLLRTSSEGRTGIGHYVIWRR